MKHTITVSFAKEADRKKEVAGLSLHFEGGNREIPIDVNGSSLLKISRRVPNLSQDLLTIASCVYAADEAILRSVEEDRWSRDISIEIPVRNLANWSSVAEELSDCLSFLTGDQWKLSFRQAEKALIQRRPSKRPMRILLADGAAVCLFSGGLDSLIGATDWLAKNPTDRLLAVGHYDRGVAGPGKDQKDLAVLCGQEFGSRFRLVQTQVGLIRDRGETSFRSRSFLFLALAAYSAEVLGPGTPILIPENGPIALNFPLTPSRRGACSTRTVHPYFIGQVNAILAKVGITNRISNPYEFATKGEMVSGCLNQRFLEKTYLISRSCAKSNRRMWWTDRSARGCGTCVPCLFRRASFHASGLDTEPYGNRVEDLRSLDGMPDDVLALASFIRRNDSDMEIASGLVANGSLPTGTVMSYVDVVKRMRSEVQVWLRARGSRYLQNLVAP